MRHIRPVLVATFLLCAAGPARGDGDPPRAPAPSPQPPPRDFDRGFEGGPVISVSNGAPKDGHDTPSFACGGGFGAQFTFRWKWLRYGFDADFALHPGAFDTVHLGLLAGVTFRPIPALRIDLLADTGMAMYFRLDPVNFGEIYGITDETVSGSNNALLPYAGGRAGIAWRFGSRYQGVFGVNLGFREDLTRHTLQRTTRSCFLAACGTTEQVWHIGGEGFYLMARIGFER